jgi:hypothetical protein
MDDNSVWHIPAFRIASLPGNSTKGDEPRRPRLLELSFSLRVLRIGAWTGFLGMDYGMWAPAVLGACAPRSAGWEQRPPQPEKIRMTERLSTEALG